MSSSTVLSKKKWRLTHRITYWDTADHTDLRSTTISDRSTIVPDYNGCCLRRALVNKVRKIRKMLSADEDISAELDRIVSRLMRLALSSSGDRRKPPCIRWMQCKLLDLLTLTEKAIERRKKRFIDSYPLKAIDFEYLGKSEEMIAIEKIRNDDAGKHIVEKYHQLIRGDPTDHEYPYAKNYMKDLDDDISIASTTEILKNYLNDTNTQFVKDLAFNYNGDIYERKLIKSNESKMERTQAWIEEDIEVVPYPNHDNFENSSGDTDYSVSNVKIKKVHKKRKRISDTVEDLAVVSKKTKRKNDTEKPEFKKDNNGKISSSIMRIPKKVSQKSSSHKYLLGNLGSNLISKEYKASYGVGIKKNKERRRPLSSKPIPKSLIELCYPEMHIAKSTKNVIDPNIYNNSSVNNQCINTFAATEESFLIDIIMEDRQETIALRRTIGTDPNDEQEILLRSIIDETLNEQVKSQTIFLNDINEPSTSKGIRHDSTNVQCGPDSIQDYSILSAATSFHKLPVTVSRYEVGDLFVKSSDFGTCTNEECYLNRTLTPRMNSASISIKDSNINIARNFIIRPDAIEVGTDCCTFTNDCNQVDTVRIPIRDVDDNIDLNSKVLQENIFKKVDSGTAAIDEFDNEKINTSTKYIVKSDELQDKNFSFTNCDNLNTKTTKYIKFCKENDNVITKTVSKKKTDGIYIKESRNYLNKIECCTMTEIPIKLWNKDDSCDIKESQTKLLEIFSIDDSNSDLKMETNEIRKNPSAHLNKRSSHIQLKLSISEEIQKTNANIYLKPKLCCGGVHVHSYKNKQISEDVIYQGQWQKCKPKALVKKKVLNPVLSKKIVESKITKVKSTSKEKLSAKIAINRKVNIEYKKLEQRQNANPVKLKSEVSKINQNDSLKNNTIFRPPTTIKKSIIRNVTKVASKITMSKVSSKTKIPFVTKIPAIISVCSRKEFARPQNLSHKNYIPPYLRRNLEKIQLSKVNTNTLNPGVLININKEYVKTTEQIISSQTEQIKKELMTFNTVPHQNINYLVFRNEIENSKNSIGLPESDSRNSSRNNVTLNRRPYSSPSQNSSTCSSPNSIATVRQASKRSKIIKKNFAHKCSMGSSGTEIVTSNKTNTPVKRGKTLKKLTDKDFDNKENVPQTSGQYSKETEKKSISNFLVRHNSVYVARLKKDSPPNIKSISKLKTLSNKSNVKLPPVHSKGQSKDQVKDVTPSISPRRVSIPEITLQVDENKQISDSDNSNIVLVIEPKKTNEPVMSIENMEVAKAADNSLLNAWLGNFDKDFQKSCNEFRVNIFNEMRQLIDEILDVIESSVDNDFSFDSETVILSRDDLNQSPEDSVTSSYKTIVTNENDVNAVLVRDLTNALNRTFDSTLGDESIISLTDTRQTITDLDFVSLTSNTIASRLSEYFLADNDLKNSCEFNNNNSVQDIFERKEQIVTQNPQGTLAFQIFSGFSLNGELIAGDQVDPVNLIDSETGSTTVEIQRQATSEELFTSGRSSGLYESSLLDEDCVVPNWLFHIISQQESVDEEEAASVALAEPPVVLPMAISDAVIDVDGNALEAVLGVGAGDGRGMHSDESQDSSGRGTSLSSTATSSGQQSEAILIDPVTGQFELLRGSDDSAVVIESNSDGAQSSANLHRNIEGAATTTALTAMRDQDSSLVFPNSVLAASDGDADISSFDADILDSSDN